MSSPQEEFESFINGLRQQRDELIVQLNLAKAEAREEWEELEQKFEHLRARSDQVAGAAGEASKDVWAALSLVGDEIKRGYERIRSKM